MQEIFGVDKLPDGRLNLPPRQAQKKAQGVFLREREQNSFREKAEQLSTLQKNNMKKNQRNAQKSMLALTENLPYVNIE